MDPGTIISVVELTGKALVTLAEVAKDLKDAPDSLATVIGETNKMHLQLQRFYSMQRDLPQETRAYLDRQVSNVECRAIVERLHKLTDKIQPHDKMNFAGRVKWLWSKSTVEDLVSGLRREADRLSNLILPEQMHNLLGSTNKIDDKVERLINMVMQLQLSQPNLNTGQQTFDQNGIFATHAATGIAWYGQWRCKPGQNFTMPYFRDRHELAEAAYVGDWPGVKRILHHAESTYRQRWINTTRIYKSNDTHKPSGFTALHQAAYHGDPIACADLLQLGAWRTLRTHRTTSTAKAHSTPLDVARSLGWQHLSEPLAPTLRRPLSPQILLKLQTRLHDLIREIFGSNPEVHLECFILPELEVLTEFERSRLWFPLDPELGDTREGNAVHVALDGDELVVAMRWGRMKRRSYRISVERGTREVEQAVLLS